MAHWSPKRLTEPIPWRFFPSTASFLLVVIAIGGPIGTIRSMPYARAISGDTGTSDLTAGNSRRPAAALPPLTSSSAYLGHMQSSESLSLTLGFRLERPDALNATINSLYDPASPDYHQWLTPEEFGRRFGRSQDEMANAVDWLKSQGFEITHVWPNNLAITFTGDVESVERALQVTIGLYQDSGNRIFFSNQQVPTLPAQLREIVQDVIGLNNAYPYQVSATSNLSPVQAHTQTKESGVVEQGRFSPEARFKNGSFYLSPSDLAVAYDATSLTTHGIQGQGQSVAIIIDSDIQESDVDLFRGRFGLPAANVRRPVIPGITPPGINKHAVETAIDVAQVSALAPAAEIDLILVPDLTMSSLMPAQEYVINTLKPDSVDESFGGCEDETYSDTERMLMLQAMTGGIAFFASSGDEGAECIQHAPSDALIESGKAEVECPACYDGVTAVGGTVFGGPTWDADGQLISLASENVWNHPPGVRFACKGREPLPKHKGLGASGGGVSMKVPMPDYQISAIGFTGGVPSASGRVVPDVAAHASLDGPCSVAAFNGEIDFVFGTSKAAPLWAGMMALIDQMMGSRQGSPNVELYRLGIQQYRDRGPLAFVDITEGDNSTGPRKPCAPDGVKGYSAGYGFDETTGWGGPDLAQLANLYGALNPGPASGPAIESLSARLAGDVLTLNVSAMDTAGAIVKAEVTLSDQLGNGPPTMDIPISARPLASGTLAIRVGAMGQFPTVENASVILVDRFGNRSLPASADFGVRDPNGPIINSVSVNRSKLIIGGVGMRPGKLGLESNGVIVAKRLAPTNLMVSFGGKTKSLNLHPGVNRIRVQRDSLFSNIFLVTL